MGPEPKSRSLPWGKLAFLVGCWVPELLHIGKKAEKHPSVGQDGSHLPFMRRRENISLSSADSVELKGAQVGRMALLLTFSLLGKDHWASVPVPMLVPEDWAGGY